MLFIYLRVVVLLSKGLKDTVNFSFYMKMYFTVIIVSRVLYCIGKFGTFLVVVEFIIL